MSSETTTTAGTRVFVDAMLAHTAGVNAEIERAAAGLATAGITGPVLDGLHELVGHYDHARGHWNTLSTALQQHETLAEQARTTGGAATDMSFYTDNTTKETMTVSVGPAAGADTGDEGMLPDTAGLTETSLEHWHGSEMVTTTDGTVCLGLYQQPDSGAYVVVATNPADTRWEPDSDTSGVDPTLSPQEAVQLADTLDDLVALAQSAPRSAAPTRMERLAVRVQGLLGDNGGVTIVGDEGEIEVSAADIRTLLDAVAPQPAVATRRKVAAKACGSRAWIPARCGRNWTCPVRSRSSRSPAPKAPTNPRTTRRVTPPPGCP